MRQNDAIFAGELSGHYYFKANFTAESSSMATFALANIVSASDLLIVVTLILSMLFSARLNLLCLGDSLAATLGVQAKHLRTFALLLASAAAAAAVSFAGLLGFVGLMVPHIARRITGSSDVHKLIPVSALLGAIISHTDKKHFLSICL